jgi:serine/threonine-protein kinase
VGKLGDGGMAEVLLVENVEGTRCVLKRVAPTLRVDRDFAEMFQAEARIVQKLRHPNIVRCLDAGAVEGIGYITFELIDGLDLARLITELAPAKIPLSAAVEVAEARTV